MYHDMCLDVRGQLAVKSLLTPRGSSSGHQVWWPLLPIEPSPFCFGSSWFVCQGSENTGVHHCAWLELDTLNGQAHE